MPKPKGVPYSWEISQPDGNDEGTDISKYSSLGAPVLFLLLCLVASVSDTFIIETMQYMQYS